MINPKSHAQSKKGKRFLSRRDYKYGGKIGGHSVMKKDAMPWHWDKDLDEGCLLHLSEKDQVLKELGEKLEIEKALGFDLAEFKMYGSRHKKFEVFAQVLEEMHSQKAFGKTERPYFEDVAYYSLPPSIDVSIEELNSMKAHAQSKERLLQEKLLQSCGIKSRSKKSYGSGNGRANLKQWLPHGELRRGYATFDRKAAFCKWRRGQELNFMNRPLAAVIEFGGPVDIVGIGIQGLCPDKYRWGKEGQDFYTAPETFKILYRLVGGDTWIGERNEAHNGTIFRGPNNPKKESTYRVNLPKVEAVKIVCRSVLIVGHVDLRKWNSTYRSSTFFNVFIYGSNLESSLDECGTTSLTLNSIKNPETRHETTVQLVEKEVIHPKCIKPNHSMWDRCLENDKKIKENILTLQAGCDFLHNNYHDLCISPPIGG